ncbi:MAG TPA: hypothetical protein VE714_10355, partial [Gemmatimonadales bacterium]|nr:hypothetical protein [Gemmatimonadales bacterium]
MRGVALLLYVVAAGCQHGTGAATADDQDMTTPEQHPDEHVGMAAEHSMAGTVSNEDLHLRLTPARSPAPGDSTRAAAVLAVMRRELAKYRDVGVAEADGFRQFLPGAGAPVQHYTKLRWALESRNVLDPAHPTSLLYERGPGGNLTLVGAMFTAP